MPRMRTAAVPGHLPVLLDEVMTGLRPSAGGRYIDGTFGGGGHTREILVQSAPNGRVLAIDADPEAIARANVLRVEPGIIERMTVVHGNFRDLPAIADEHQFRPVDGVLLDLGLSSFQLDDPSRGFAFRLDGPLDMRFDPTQGSPAADLVNAGSAEQIADVIWRYGEESRSRRIAAAIVREREREPIVTTGRLASIIESSLGGRRGSDTHPATRSFQALRIAVNDELGVLERTLDAAISLLAPGGRLAVIAFHSLEDRIVKQLMRLESTDCICPPEQPVCTCTHKARVKLVGKAIRPSANEIKANGRSRSAVLRIAERLAEPAAPSN